MSGYKARKKLECFLSARMVCTITLAFIEHCSCLQSLHCCRKKFCVPVSNEKSLLWFKRKCLLTSLPNCIKCTVHWRIEWNQKHVQVTQEGCWKAGKFQQRQQLDSRAGSKAPFCYRTTSDAVMLPRDKGWTGLWCHRHHNINNNSSHHRQAWSHGRT